MLELSLITKEVFNFLTKCSDFIYSGKSFGSPFSTFAYIIYFIYSILRLPSLLARGCTTLYHLFTSHRLYHTVLRSVWRFFQTFHISLNLFQDRRDKVVLQGRKKKQISFSSVQTLEGDSLSHLSFGSHHPKSQKAHCPEIFCTVC